MAPPPTAPRQSQASAPAAEAERSVRELDLENVERHKRLQELFQKRRLLMIDSDAWRFASRSERKHQLGELKAEFRQREAWLKQEYRRRREALLKDPAATGLGQNTYN
jgi:hypothetical protein